jgi:hypothetical protein
MAPSEPIANIASAMPSEASESSSRSRTAGIRAAQDDIAHR